MTISQIKAFLEVGKNLNYTKAAANLYITQSALSKQISSLENELGIQLFSRSTRSVALTEAGDALYHAMIGIPEKVEIGVERAQRIQRMENNALHIGVLDGHLIDGVLEKRLSLLVQKFPDLQVHVSGASFRMLREGLRSHIYDMIITLGFDVEDVEDFDFCVVEKHRTGMAVSKNSAFAQRSVVPFEEFAGEPFVVISENESPRGYRDFIRECKRFCFEPNIVREANTLESQLLCVEFGQGAALIDRATRLENSQNVCIVDLEKPNIVDIVCAWLKDRPKLNNYVRQAIEFILAE